MFFVWNSQKKNVMSWWEKVYFVWIIPGRDLGNDLFSNLIFVEEIKWGLQFFFLLTASGKECLWFIFRMWRSLEFFIIITSTWMVNFIWKMWETFFILEFFHFLLWTLSSTFYQCARNAFVWFKLLMTFCFLMVTFG